MTREDVETAEDFSDIAPEEFEDLDLSGLDSDKWVWLLIFQPQFADKCDWNKLPQVDIECLLKSHPDLEKYIPKK